MLTMQLDIKMEQQGSTIILTLEGGLCGMEAHKFSKQAEKLTRHEAQALLLDLTRLTQLDSSGIGILNQVRVDCKRQGRRLAMIEPLNAQVRQALGYSQLNRLIESFADGATALEMLKAAPQAAVEPTAIAPPTSPHAGSQAIKSPAPAPAPAGAIEQRLENLERCLGRIERLLEKILEKSSAA